MQANHSLLFIVLFVVVFLVAFVLFFFFRKNRRSQASSGSEQIYIGNLPYRTNEHDLHKLFSQYGHIQNVRIVKDRRTGRSKGYAFVTFSDDVGAKKSLASHGTELAGRSLVVHIAKPR